MPPKVRPVAVAGAVALAATTALGIGIAGAQTDDTPDQTPSESEAARPGRPDRPGPKLDAAAQALNLSVEDLRTKLRDEDKTLAQVAQEQGVDVQTVIDAMVADANEHLDQAVAEGRISAERADERRANLVEHITRLVNEGLPAHRPHGPGRHRPKLDAAAAALNLSVEDLRTKLRDEDKTLAQVAQEQGVDVQTVIDAMVAAASQHLDQAVADGRISAEQADERRANLVERITRLVNEGPPAPGERGPRGPFGPPPDGAPEAQPEGSSQTN